MQLLKGKITQSTTDRPPVFSRKILCRGLCALALWISVASPLSGASFPILPEFQLYHSLGTRGSSYTSGAYGFSLHLFDENSGPGRFLQFLIIHVPHHTAGWQNRLGDVFLESNGQGYEISVHDQWENPEGKGATLSLRHIGWSETSRGGAMLGEAAADLLHMGWSWSPGRSPLVVWLFGLDIASLHLPLDQGLEVQVALGMRTVF